MSQIETIFTQEAKRGVEHTLGIDDRGYLCWDGRRVETESRISLTRIQTILAAGTVFATWVIAIAAVVDLLMRP
jgi:hypothetical protein